MINRKLGIEEDVMGAGKRHRIVLDYSVVDIESGEKVETLGGNLRIGMVKQEHLPLYNEVVDRKVNEIKAELAQMEADGKFA